MKVWTWERLRTAENDMNAAADACCLVVLFSKGTSKCFSLPAKLREKVCVDVFPPARQPWKNSETEVFCRLYKRIFLILLSSSDQMLTNKTGENLIFNQNWTCTGAIVASWPDNASGGIATAPPTGQAGPSRCYRLKVARAENDQTKRAKLSVN